MNIWDERYGGHDYFYGQEPNDFLRVCAPHIKSGARILSLGEGEGRNAYYLLTLGHELVCIDGSEQGRRKTMALCQDFVSRLDYRVEDLASSDFNDNCFDAVISIWCHLPSQLRSQVHKAAVRALKPGGLFILEAYRPEQIPLGTGGPKDPDLLLTMKQCAQELEAMDLLLLQETQRYINEGKGHQGMSATVQVLAVTRS